MLNFMLLKHRITSLVVTFVRTLLVIVIVLMVMVKTNEIAVPWINLVTVLFVHRNVIG